MFDRKVWYITIVVIIAERFHLFPYRTQKLSFLTPKVLVGTLTGRIGHRHFPVLDRVVSSLTTRSFSFSPAPFHRQDLTFHSDTPTPHPPFLPLFSLHPSLTPSLFDRIDSPFIFLLAINYLIYINFAYCQVFEEKFHKKVTKNFWINKKTLVERVSAGVFLFDFLYRYGIYLFIRYLR